MNKKEAQIQFWAAKYFPHLLPAHRNQLVVELLKLHLLQLAILNRRPEL